jgi:hypothetical protein
MSSATFYPSCLSPAPLLVTVVCLGFAVDEAVGVGAGSMMLPPKVSQSTICGAEPRVGEGFGPAAEAFVGGDRDRRLLLSLGQDLEEQFGAAAVEFHVAEFVDAEKVDAAVPGDGLGQDRCRHPIAGTLTATPPVTPARRGSCCPPDRPLPRS